MCAAGWGAGGRSDASAENSWRAGEPGAAPAARAGGQRHQQRGPAGRERVAGGPRPTCGGAANHVRKDWQAQSLDRNYPVTSLTDWLLFIFL